MFFIFQPPTLDPLRTTTTPSATMEDRRRLATPELTHWVKKIKKKMTSSPPLGALNDAGPGFRPGYVLRLRLSRREREMLEVAAADEGGRDPPLPGAGPPRLAEQVAVLLFLRWYVSTYTHTSVRLEHLVRFVTSQVLRGLFPSLRSGQ